jgi:dUTP pyrophosphatase
MPRYFKKLTDDAIIPQRATRNSAGYDISASETVTIQPNEIKLVPTGLAVKMYNEDEVFMLFDRSSNPMKRGIRLANSVGIIDSDYYPNEFMGMFQNITDHPVTIEKGQRIMQGIFTDFWLTDDDKPLSEERNGGIGSTGDFHADGVELPHTIVDDPTFHGVVILDKE